MGRGSRVGKFEQGSDWTIRIAFGELWATGLFSSCEVPGPGVREGRGNTSWSVRVTRGGSCRYGCWKIALHVNGRLPKQAGCISRN